MGIAVGIDLGTTNSCVAVVQNNRARVLEDSAGRRIHPSILSFLPDGKVVFGHAAKDKRLTDPQNTVYASKRLIGRNLASFETQHILEELPYKVAAGPDGIPLVSVRNRQVSLPEVSALMLQNLKSMCFETLNVEIKQAVITVPANFDDVQRSSTKVAGRIAGFDVLRIINEPTAAALAYGFGGKRTERIAVYDFGGGTFDITIVELSDEIFEVLSTAGDTYLGGEDFDKAILGEMLREFKKTHKVDLDENPAALQRLRNAAERVKCQLSTLSNVQATLQNISEDARGNKLDFFFKLSRKRFEELVQPLVDRSLKVCDEALKLAGLKVTDLHNLVMVGGTTRMPIVRKRTAEKFGIVPRTEINPDEVVAIGAAIQAFSLTGEQLPDVLPQKPRPQSAIKPQSATTKPPPRRGLSSGGVEPLGLDVKKQTPKEEPEAFGLDVKKPAPKEASEALELDVRKPKPKEEPEAFGLDVKKPGPKEEPEALGLDVKKPKPVWRVEPLGAEAKTTSPGKHDESMGMDVKKSAFSAADAIRATIPDLVVHKATQSGAFGDLELEPKPMSLDLAPKSASLDLAPKSASLDLAPKSASLDREPKPTSLDLAPKPMSLDLEPKPFQSDSKAVSVQRSFDAVSDPSPGFDWDIPVEKFKDFDATSPRVSEPQMMEDEVAAVPGFESPSIPPPSGHTESPTSVEVTDAARARGALLLDVTPRALGIAVAGGYCDIVISRNAAIPVEQSRLFTTSTDFQTEVSIDIYQGESRRVEDNTKLGHILLNNLRSAPRGAVKIRVTFEIDTDGILGVSAKNEESSEAERTKIVLAGGMDEETVSALVRQYSAK